MSFNLDALLHEPIELYEKPSSFKSPSRDASRSEAAGGLWAASVDAEEVVAEGIGDAGVRDLIVVWC
jgi:hypothetical protein